MRCPACKEPMIVLELDEVEIDHCVFCGGIWLDAGELELLLGTSGRKDELLNSFKVARDVKEEIRKCPICLKRMDKVLCGMPACCLPAKGGRADREKKFLIDKCRRNDGIWFDLGELEEIIKMGSFDKESKVPDLLRDMFRKP